VRLRYLIGLDQDQGAAGTLTVVGYDATTPPVLGVGAKYVNLRDEKGAGNLGPYLTIPNDDIERDYGVRAPDPAHDGFWSNLRGQLDLAVAQGFHWVELDNLDTYDVGVALRCLDEAHTRGLRVLVKNPCMVHGDERALVLHPAAAATITEEDCGTVAQVLALRADLPAYFVAYGSDRSWAEARAAEAHQLGAGGVGVTFSPGGEYTNTEEIIAGGAQPMPQVPGTKIIELARSFRGKLTDGQDVVMMATTIAQRWPEMATYCRGAGPDTPWCGIYNAYIHTLAGIRPPYSANSSDYDDFMWADAPIEGRWGTQVTRAQAQPGDTVVLRVPHHITFLDHDAGDGETFYGTGGNQSNGVTTAQFYWKNIRGVVRAPGVGDGPADTHPEVKLGSTGDAVRELQQRLGIPQTGTFDAATDQRVRAYQFSRGLDVDGEVGPDTWGALRRNAPPVSDVPHAAEYVDQWQRMSILPARASQFQEAATRLLRSKTRYQAAERRTGVPWFLIAAWHERESSQDFTRQLAQGDPLGEVSHNEPSGRGPFATWEESAYDALVTLKHLDKVTSWPVEQLAYRSEQYNGPGYRNHGVPSAYLWAGTNIYLGGKYVHDGPSGWDPTFMDPQPGVMPLIHTMMTLDSSIQLEVAPINGEVIPPTPAPQPLPPQWWATLLPLLLALTRNLDMKIDLNKLLPIILPLVTQMLAQRTGQPTSQTTTPVGPNTNWPVPQPAPDPLAAIILELLHQLTSKQDAPAAADDTGGTGIGDAVPRAPSETAAAASVDLRSVLAAAAAWLASVMGGILGTPVGSGSTIMGQLIPIAIALAGALGVPSWVLKVLGIFAKTARK
jgi:lysozyme family protein